MATGRLTQSTLFQCADFQISTNSSKPLKRKSIQEDVNRSSCSSGEEFSSCSLHRETKKKSLQQSEQCWSDTTDSEDICLESETSRCSVLSKNPQSDHTTLVINSSLSSTPRVQSGCSKVPDDIAYCILHQLLLSLLYSLSTSRSQLLFILENLGHLIQHGTVFIHG